MPCPRPRSQYNGNGSLDSAELTAALTKLGCKTAGLVESLHALGCTRPMESQLIAWPAPEMCNPFCAHAAYRGACTCAYVRACARVRARVRYREPVYIIQAEKERGVDVDRVAWRVQRPTKPTRVPRVAPMQASSQTTEKFPEKFPKPCPKPPTGSSLGL